MRSASSYTGDCATFWKKYSIRDGHSQPGNPKAANELSADKAKKILEDGTIRGKAITPKQRRYFGFIAGGG